jgi:hypothetical protein
MPDDPKDPGIRKRETHIVKGCKTVIAFGQAAGSDHGWFSGMHRVFRAFYGSLDL